MDANVPAGSVVVGVDGSPASAAALRWGLRAAGLRGLELWLVCGFAWPPAALSYSLLPEVWIDEDLRRNAVKSMDELVGSAAELAPGVRVGGVVLDGTPAAVLVEESRRAAIVVVGTRGSGGFVGMRLGSVSHHVAMHAECTVVVVPADHDPVRDSARPVVVGVDGSETAGLAARFAFEEAALRGVDALAVRAWVAPAYTWPTGLPGRAATAVDREQTERDLLAACVARWRYEHPGVRVELRTVAGHAAQSLVAVAEEGQLLVVGSRGLGGFRGLLLGSVSSAVLHHAPGPVAVVHVHHDVQPEGTRKMSERTGSVVAGVDDSDASRAGVDLAAQEASRRRLPLRLVHGYVAPVPHSAVGFVPYPLDVQAPLHHARAVVAAAAHGVRQRHPDLDVTTAVTVGGPAGVLVEESGAASLVVVGCRGSGGFARLLAGSVSTQVATYAHCPVIVVRPPAGPDGRPLPVVVGVDGSPESALALGFGFEEASARGVPLTAIYVWQALPRANLGPITRWHYDPAEATQEARRLLAEAVAGWQEKYPEVAVRQRAVYDFNPAETLVDASQEASLVVVGSRGLGGFTGMLLGSVGRALVHHAHCPVTVVRAD